MKSSPDVQISLFDCKDNSKKLIFVIPEKDFLAIVEGGQLSLLNIYAPVNIGKKVRLYSDETNRSIDIVPVKLVKGITVDAFWEGNEDSYSIHPIFSIEQPPMWKYSR